MSRQYMIDYRAKHGYSLTDMARKAGCTEALLDKIESWEDEVTHPKIAARIARAYKLKKSQYESLMPEHYRPSSPNFNPKLYKADAGFADFEVVPMGRKWQ